jgi:anti-anti-sigma factor
MARNDLSCEAEHADEVVTLRLRGTLRADTAPVLRAAVLKSLTDEPAAVVIDMAGVDEIDDLGLIILPTLARALAAWPGAKLAVTRASPRIVRRLRATPMDYLLTIADSEGALRAATRRDVSPPMLSEQLPAGPAAVTVARLLVRRICESSPMAALADEAELVISELVTNASLHGRPPIWLTASRRRNLLHLAIRDCEQQEPRIGGRDSEFGDGRDGGRGLLVVDALCVAWGCTPTANGKVVWATMRSRERTG